MRQREKEVNKGFAVGVIWRGVCAARLQHVGSNAASYSHLIAHEYSVVVRAHHD